MKTKNPYDGPMRWALSVSILGSLAVHQAGCTRPNPLFCGDGNCTDPDFPFCDIDGSLGGKKQTCIAVSCTPSTFAECRGDVALTCNADGNNYDELQCAKGCAPSADGCRLCDPNQTVCANGEVQTCDANGDVVASETCALGCFADQPRCREIDPSNGLGMYLDMVTNPPDLLLDDASFNTDTGEVRDGATSVAVPSFTIPAPSSGVPIRVFVAGSVTIKNATITTSISSNRTGPAFAVVARGAITITGSIKAAGDAGAITTSACVVGNGTAAEIVGPQGQHIGFATAGGGGGGHATAGGKGGGIIGSPSVIGGAGGQPSGSDSLVPLRGGCPAGSTEADGNRGGGAIQLSSRTKIEVDGVIDVQGEIGADGPYDQLGGIAVSGGGGGGGILIEAPQVTLGPSCQLKARGGDGGTGCPNSVICGAGGVAASPGVAAGIGKDVAEANGDCVGGGGGGGLGRIRINTPDRTYVKSNTTIEDGQSTTGTLSTR